MQVELGSLIAAALAFGVPTIGAAMIVWGKLQRLDQKVDGMCESLKKLSLANEARACEEHRVRLEGIERRVQLIEGKIQ